jgi:TrmH family RNA methyltransferase
MEELKTLTNKQAKFIKLLQITQSRKKVNRILIEGKKCCEEAINSKLKIDYFIVEKEKIDKNVDIINLILENNGRIYQTVSWLYKKLHNATNTPRVIAIAEPKINVINDEQSFILLDNITDPGNVGTIIRTAEWFGINQLLFFGNGVDKYAPKIIRSTMGSIFRMNLINIDNNLSIFQEHFSKVPIYAAALDGNISIKDLNVNSPFGLVIGNESRGISPILKKVITESFYINGYGNAESLNVAVAAGISLFYLTNKV